ncbi:MAG: hypothetical protein C4331_00585 [Meiothermus sp.]
MNEDLRLFYGGVRRTREVVFRYCEGLPQEIYVREHPDFGFGSIRNLHTHVAECYLWWVGTVGLGKPEVRDSVVPDVAAIRELFAKVDGVVEEGLESFTRPDELFTWTNPHGGQERLSQRWLILHPTTHEFHHKGQMVALGRVLGHPVPSSHDTDLLAP